MRLHSEQVLRVGLRDEPVTLDPALVDDPASAAVVDQLFARLLRYRPDLSVEPDLAESYTVSPDGKTYTFRLREWKWSDGRPGTAGDFVYALRRQADPRTAAPHTAVVEAIRGGVALVGALGSIDEPKRPSDADLQRLRDAFGVRAVDDRTLQIDLVSATPCFLTMLPQSSLAPLRQDVIEKHGDRWTRPDTLVVNGPFILDRWIARQKLTLGRNPGYHGRPSSLARVDLIYQADSAALTAYERGELDIVGGIPATDQARVRQDARLRAEMSPGPRLTTCYVAFAHKKKPFDNLRVRQAFQLALDGRLIAEETLGGAASCARSFIPPGMPGHQPDLSLGYDPSRAARLLAEVGYGYGHAFPRAVLAYPATPTNKAVAERVQSELRRNLGVDLSLEGWNAATFLDRVAADGPALALLRWSGDYPHPHGWLKAAFHSSAAPNTGRWSNADFDRLVDQAAVEQNERQALDLYARAQRILVEEAAALWLYHPAPIRLVKPWVKGLVPTPSDPAPGSRFWSRVQIEAH